MLSVFSGVGGWGWFRLIRICLIGMVLLALKYTPAISTSAADDTTYPNILYSTSIVLLRKECVVLLEWSNR